MPCISAAMQHSHRVTCSSDGKTGFAGLLTDIVSWTLRLVKAKPAVWHASSPEALGQEDLSLRQAAYCATVAVLTGTQQTHKPIVMTALKCVKGVWPLLMDTVCNTARRSASGALIGGIPFLAVGTAFQSAAVAAQATVASAIMPRAQRASNRILAAAASLMPTQDADGVTCDADASRGVGRAKLGPAASLFSYSSLAAEGDSGGNAGLKEGGSTGPPEPDVEMGTDDSGADQDGPESGTAVIEIDFWTSQPAFSAMLRAVDRLAAGFPDDPAKTDVAMAIAAGAAEILQAFDSGGDPTGTAELGSEARCLPVRLWIVKLVLSRPAFFRAQVLEWTPRLITCMLTLHEWSLTALSSAGGADNDRACMPAAFSAYMFSPRKRESLLRAAPAPCAAFHYLLRDVCMLLCYSWCDLTAEGGAKDGAVAGGTTPALQLHASATAMAPLPQPWVPSAPADVALCSSFLDYLVRAAPTTQRALLDVHLGFIGVLSQRWMPAGKEWAWRGFLFVSPRHSGFLRRLQAPAFRTPFSETSCPVLTHAACHPSR